MTFLSKKNEIYLLSHFLHIVCKNEKIMKVENDKSNQLSVDDIRIFLRFAHLYRDLNNDFSKFLTLFIQKMKTINELVIDPTSHLFMK